MKFVDAHIHLSDPEYSQKVDELVKDAKLSNVVALVSNSMDLQTSLESLRLVEEHPRLVHAALGIHPWAVKQLLPNELEDTVNLILQHGASSKKIVAVGEIGLDLTYSKDMNLQDMQLRVFQEMLKAAEKTTLPVIIHSRGTITQIMNILPSYGVRKILLHWFSHPMKLLSEAIERGYYITEGPPSVYSHHIQEIIKQTPLTSLLTETDGPVRFSGPFKNEMTTPSFIPLVVDAISQLKKVNKTDVANQIIKNFADFFGITLR